MIDRAKVDGILRNLDKYVAYLRALTAVPRDDFLSDFTKTGSARYYLQVAIECCLDAANHVIAGESLPPHRLETNQPTLNPHTFTAASILGRLKHPEKVTDGDE